MPIFLVFFTLPLHITEIRLYRKFQENFQIQHCNLFVSMYFMHACTCCDKMCDPNRIAQGTDIYIFPPNKICHLLLKYKIQLNAN